MPIDYADKKNECKHDTNTFKLEEFSYSSSESIIRFHHVTHKIFDVKHFLNILYGNWSTKKRKMSLYIYISILRNYHTNFFNPFQISMKLIWDHKKKTIFHTKSSFQISLYLTQLYINIHETYVHNSQIENLLHFWSQLRNE